MDKKIKTGLKIAGIILLIYLLTRKKKDKDKEILESKVELPNVEILNSENEEWFLKNDESNIIKEFKENLEELGLTDITRYRDYNKNLKTDIVNGIADDNFMTDIANLIGDSSIADGEKLSISFVKDVNIILGQLIKPDFTFKRNKQIDYSDAEVIKKGDKGKEVNTLKETLNFIIGENVLRVDGNYDRKLYKIILDVFPGTSVYSNKNNEGRINKEFIINLHNLLIKTN